MVELFSKGTGIGLYMSKVIIETNMDGGLSVFNNNKEAVFIVSFKNCCQKTGVG